MILVTGATGLLGSRLLFDLVSSGEEVRALKRVSSSLNLLNFWFRDHPQLLNKIEWVTGDITDLFALSDALSKVGCVYHCAGKVSFQPSEREKMHLSNIQGTANVVNLSLEAGVKKLCHVSSIAALGRTGGEEVIDENAMWKSSKFNSEYAISKYGAEREVWRGVAEGLNAVIVNPGVIIGPGNWNTDSSMLFKQVWKGLKFYTSGINGFVDVRDVSGVMIRLMNSDIINERYILVSENKPFKDVFDRISDDLGRQRPGIYAGNILRSLAWRMELIKSLVTGSKPVITRETARSASGKFRYSNNKIQQASGIKFIPVNESIDFTSKLFLEEKSKLN